MAPLYNALGARNFQVGFSARQDWVSGLSNKAKEKQRARIREGSMEVWDGGLTDEQTNIYGLQCKGESTTDLGWSRTELFSQSKAKQERSGLS